MGYYFAVLWGSLVCGVCVLFVLLAFDGILLFVYFCLVFVLFVLFCLIWLVVCDLLFDLFRLMFLLPVGLRSGWGLFYLGCFLV